MGTNKTGLICLAISSKNILIKIIKSKMTYSESGSDFSFAINSVSDFDFASETDSDTDSESDSSLAVMNQDICIFFIYTCIPLNKPATGFFIHSHNRINSYASNASIMHISFGTSLPKKFVFITLSNFLNLTFMYVPS